MVKLPFTKKAPVQQNKFLAVTVNSDDIKCLAFYFDGGNFKIVGTGKQELSQGSVRNGVIIEKDKVEEALKIAIDQAHGDTEGRIQEAIFGINGDLCLGITTTIRIKRPKGKTIEKKEVMEIYDKISEAAYIQAQNEYLQSSGNPDIDLEIVTSSNVYIKIDDQYFEDIEGQQGSVIEMAVFNAFTPTFHLKKLQDLAKGSGLSIKAGGPEMYAFCQWIKKIKPGTKDFIIIDMANDSTNVAIVFGGGIIATKSLNIGYLHIVESLGQNMGLTLPESEKVLKAYSLGQLTDSEIKIVQNRIQETLNIWISGIELLFGEFTGVKTFASKVFLTGRGIGLKDIAEFIETEPWTKAIPFKMPPEFERLSMSDFQKLSDSTGRANSSEWVNTTAMSVIYEEMPK